MAAKKQPAPDQAGGAKRKAMPFEPRSTQSEKAQSPQKAEKKSSQPAAAQTARSTRPQKTASAAIPEAVSRRMVRRIALFSGIPTALGMSTFIASYLVVSNGWFELPSYAVLLVSLGWFGLGVVGVSYGLLSASWDEETTGSRLGWSEFRMNLGRMTTAWKGNKDQS
jgi:Photosynthesis affected mutant 68